MVFADKIQTQAFLVVAFVNWRDNVPLSSSLEVTTLTSPPCIPLSRPIHISSLHSTHDLIFARIALAEIP